ncbi:MAG: hypothetical protein A2Y62_19900 [Candidatus Fischerbacteria bacterium RBG_13_37_8]|uniref:Uncharacterized protein n=1 Tax=Candidatus Fischerbacteria bacterium RBG_13_37_8 TaxID=1817863 RepID=A0A1F5VNV1_9BACT|nr:MAG: hypothetical protein A2Y62_19900 [Candidatus Fischerbacteria bacterium RBG_13_37_8]
MNKKFFAIMFMFILLQGYAIAENTEQWKCTIDLHQGDSGTMEINRNDAAIEGKIIVQRGAETNDPVTFETPFHGKWEGNTIDFTRLLSQTSQQPFNGSVSPVEDNKVTMQGRFAAKFSGTWSAECERITAAKPEEKTGVNKVVVIDKKAIIGKIALVKPGVLIDFIGKAPEAKWTNAWTILPFPGDVSNSKGFVRLIENVKLEDGKTYPLVLETHPHWQPRGICVGRYANIAIPETGAEFRAAIGFLDGATKSDGVYYEVRGEFESYTGIPVRREYHKPYGKYLINDFSQDFSRFKGLTGTIALSVDAGTKSSTQDWAVWVEPRLVSLENETVFASFVGGAVGTAHQGDKLINAWGGKSGCLYGNVVLYLMFSHIDNEYSVKIESYYKDQHAGNTDLGPIKPGQSEIWHSLSRTQEGPWREQIIFNGTYSGEIRYTISKSGE